MDEMYHSCRWCHHYSNEKCKRMSSILEDPIVSPIVTLIEEGKMEEAVKESFTQPELCKTRKLLLQYLSGKKCTEVLKALEEDLERNKGTWVEEIGFSIALVVEKAEPSVEEFYIREPESFYCKYFE